MPFFMQLWFCVPLWILVALFVSIRKAMVTKEPRKRTLGRRWAIVCGFALLTSLLWANPTQMLLYSGPFRGRVVDAQTGKPVPVALLSFEWYGSLGMLSTHHAWTLTDANGSYWLGWQGIGNWRIGSFPGPDSMTITAPGYLGGQFWLDGQPRDPYSNHDRTALGASMTHGDIRLQRLRSDARLDLEASRNFGFGVPADHREDVAQRFHRELFSRLCPQAGATVEWEPTNAAFQQLVQYAGFLGISTSNLHDDMEKLIVGYQRDPSRWNTPVRFDAAIVEELCSELKLTNPSQ